MGQSSHARSAARLSRSRFLASITISPGTVRSYFFTVSSWVAALGPVVKEAISLSRNNVPQAVPPKHSGAVLYNGPWALLSII